MRDWGRRCGVAMLVLVALQGEGCARKQIKDDPHWEGDVDESSAPSGSTARDALELAPMHSAYLAKHLVQLPIAIEQKTSARVTFRASDQSLVHIEPSAQGALLTMRKSGTTTIEATAGKQSAHAKLVISPFTEREWQAGRERFHEGRPLARDDDDRPLLPSAEEPDVRVPPDTSCAACHGDDEELRELFDADLRCSPEQTGRYSDRELTEIIMEGKKPVGARRYTDLPLTVWQAFHQWNADELEAGGLVAYLRSLTPAPVPR